MTECISCIKDAKTGICRDVKDKTARELIEELKTSLQDLNNTVQALSGVDGGHLATDKDIEELQSQIYDIDNTITDLENDKIGTDDLVRSFDITEEYEPETKKVYNAYSINEMMNIFGQEISNISEIYADKNSVTELQNQVNTIQSLVDGLSGNVDGLVTTEQFNTLQTAVTSLQTAINNLDSTYAKDSDITSLQGQINSITGSVNDVIDTINNLDNTYAKDSDITALSDRVTTLENAGGGTSLKTQTFTVPLDLYNFLLSLTYDNLYGIKLTLSTETKNTSYNGHTVTIKTNSTSVISTDASIKPVGTYFYYKSYDNLHFKDGTNTLEVINMLGTSKLILVDTTFSFNSGTVTINYTNALYKSNNFTATVYYFE